MNRRLLAALLIGAALLAAGCSSDPAAPPAAPDPGADGVIHVPGEVATLAAAVAAAAAGDTLVIASGTHVGAATVTRSLVIMGAAGGEERPILDTSGGGLQINLDAPSEVELHDLRLQDGDTALALDLNGGWVWVNRCEISGATHGLTVDGSDGDPNVAIRQTTFLNCGGTDGEGLRIRGENWVTLQAGRFIDTGGGSGVGVLVSDESRLDLEGVVFVGLESGAETVAAVSGDGQMIFSGVRFDTCTGTLVDFAGVVGSVFNADFVACHGTMIRLRGDGVDNDLFACRVRDCSGTFLEVGAGHSTSLYWSRFSNHTGPLIELGAAADLTMVECTAVDVHGPVAAVESGGQVEVVRCLVVDAATPVITGGTVTIRSSDFWRADGGSAWYGLAGFVGVDGNIEADPLFCDAAAEDFGLQEGSPCELEGGLVIGAFGVGCE